ncbi:Peptide chain release factor 1 [Mycoplasmoides gallisepticum str. F]|uniref:Peptide chain release factor 1 n=1 Tax=Mycoplasmoides gallisepticum S6 TaxID=1006581 RepID=A0A0F6CK32_MYCGL|nr:peptide chain release factor 1 [Mycoplasmoides gallisepticum]ADC31084.1 Peptide chain release factor 1 [Mycoplasmoides gallisepticum str. F]AHB99454.1 peptide chain release factor 1 [Mycoplasmoides gallisepticum S6]
MEYNKQMYETLVAIRATAQKLNKELESLTNDFKRIHAINKELKQKKQLLEVFELYDKLVVSGLEAEKIINDNTMKEFHELAILDLDAAKEQIPDLEEKLKVLLLPADPNDDKEVIVEMRPAAGGDESSIFVGNMFDLYKEYCSKHNWKINVIEMLPTSVGYSFISFEINGEDVYSKMKFESGVHRVQRVPATEAKGRVHTSTITIAVLPQQDDVEIEINPADLRIDTYRASGAGGQHVNRTESAVRITHIPTGIVAACQEGKSQIANRETAMKMLRSKLWEAAEKEKNDALSALRKNQVGSGDRAEKIRTYNYPQNRVTDHRINMSLNSLDRFMMGEIDEMIDALRSKEQEEKMKLIMNE